MYIGMPSGEIRIGPFSRITSRLAWTVVKPPMPVAMISADPHGVERLAVGPARVGDRLVSGHDGELGEAVEPPRLLYGKVVGGVEASQ